MYDFSAPLFWFKFVFLLEIIIAEVLIAYRMKRKKYFALRASLAAVCLLAVTFALPVPFYNAVYSSFLFMIIFLCSLVSLRLCLNEPWGNIVYCGFFSYNQQHISYQFYSLLCLIFGIDANNNIYGNVMGDISQLQLFLFLIPHVIVYLIGWALLTHRFYRKGGESFNLHNFKLLIFSIIIVSINVTLNAFVVYNMPIETAVFVRSIIIFYNIFSCVLAMVMLISIVGREEIANEYKFIENLWRNHKQIYELSKENVDFINMKCHDIRHRIRNARQKEVIDEKELAEIEQAIGIYDGLIKTGNEVLDVIISEESAFCNKNGIKLLCNIDGAQLNFMQPADLYSIFQNGIHNAIDAVMKIEEKERRIIRLNIKRVASIISVHMENYICEGEAIVFKDGLPVTNSKDRDFHGFGMRSIRISVEKYNGYVKAGVKDNVFGLDMMIPVRSEKTEGTADV